MSENQENRPRIGSWLDGPGLPGEGGAYAGERLGLPEQGPGSLAGLSRRIPAIMVDWVAALLIAHWLLPGRQFGPLLVLAVVHAFTVGTVGASPGHRLFGLRVVSVGEGGFAGPVRATVRTLLLCLVIPAAIWDADQRGMHDRLAGTVLLKS